MPEANMIVTGKDQEQSVEHGQASAPVQKPDRKKTAGEIFFDRTVYTGIGFGLNEVISLIFADKFQYGSGKIIGKQGFEKASDWIAKTFKFKPKIKNGQTISAKTSAGNSLLWISLTSGGFILLLPMKWLEDHKAGVVKWMNHVADKFGGTQTQEQIAARDAEVEQTIACEPKQSWGSLLKGRFIAIAASIGLGTLLGEARSESIKQTSDKILSGAAEKIGMQKALKSDVFHRYTRLIGVETVSCATSSMVLEIASKFFAKKKQPKGSAPSAQEGDNVTALPQGEKSQYSQSVAKGEKPARRLKNGYRSQLETEEPARQHSL
jgi:hypothetical protein